MLITVRQIRSVRSRTTVSMQEKGGMLQTEEQLALTPSGTCPAKVNVLATPALQENYARSVRLWVTQRSVQLLREANVARWS
jgi:hypothetical protein